MAWHLGFPSVYLCLLLPWHLSLLVGAEAAGDASRNLLDAAAFAAANRELGTLFTIIEEQAFDEPAEPPTWDFPTKLTLRGGVLHAPPFATVEEQPDGSFVYGGFQVDLLDRMKIFASQMNITLNFQLSPSPPMYGDAFDLVANDCNTTAVNNTLEDCNKFDFIVANFYATPERSLRAQLSPPWLRSTISTVKYVDKTGRDYTTLTQASEDKANVCLKEGTFYAGVVKAKFPDATYVSCPDLDGCLDALKREECVLHCDDELQLRFREATDPSLEVTREQFNTQVSLQLMMETFMKLHSNKLG